MDILAPKKTFLGLCARTRLFVSLSSFFYMFYSIIDARFGDLIHHFDNKDKGNCAIYQEFLVPPMIPEEDGYDLRGLQCRWVDEDRAYRCFDGKVQCPDHITPSFLEVAKNQPICTEQRGEYFCRLTCTDDGAATWFGTPCPADGVSPCPPWPRTMLPNYKPDTVAPPSTLQGPAPAPAEKPAPKKPEVAPALRGDKFSGAALLAQATSEEREIIEKKGGFDLRGIAVSLYSCVLYVCLHSCPRARLPLQCEVKDGEERCFYEDTEGRDLCPPRISAVKLATGDGQYLCTVVR